MKYKSFSNIIVSIFLLLCLVLSLCGCAHFRYDFEDLEQGNIRLIEFYNLSEAEYRNSQAVLEAEPYAVAKRRGFVRFGKYGGV